MEPMEHTLVTLKEVEFSVPNEHQTTSPIAVSPGETSSSSSEYSDADDKLAKVADWLSQMNVLREDLVRAVPTHLALSWFGYVLRSQKNTKNKMANFQRSRHAEKFAEFWSHSWQMAAWRKILTLLFLKNGFPALCVGSLAALLGFSLSFTQILPSVLGFGGKVSFWSTLFGVLAFFTTLLLWRKQDPVFLDVCCINQVDEKEKSAGILGLGGVLKRSQKMLVLWDRSYNQRLWCMFELAAFIKSQEGKTPKIEIRPTLLGPCAAAIFAAVLAIVLILATMISHQQQGDVYLIVITSLLFVILYPAAATFRHYFHSVDVMCLQLQEFKLEKTLCHCCTEGHQDESGEESLCDRKIVQRCIDGWFGSQEEFENLMKSVVLTSVSKQLGEHLFPYWLLLVSSMPFTWIVLDLAVENLLFIKLGQFWLFWLISGLGFWLGAFPTCIAVFLFWAKKFRRPRKWLCCDLLINLVVILGLVPAFVAIFGILVVLSLFSPLTEVPVAVLCSCFYVLFAWLLWDGPSRCRRRPRKPAANQQDDQIAVENAPHSFDQPAR